MIPHILHRTHQAVEISGTDPWVIVVDIGTGLWVIAYIIAIVQGFKQKTYAVPLVAIAANFTWEVLASFKWVAPIKLWHIGAIVWMLFDITIVYSLFRYGRNVQVIPEIKKWFYPVVIGTFILAYIFQEQFAQYYNDDLGFEDAYLINNSMSILFIFMYFTRREAGDMAYWVAWLKMLGTGVTSLSMYFLLPKFYPQRTEFDFMTLLYCGAFGFDVIYVLLLTKARLGEEPVPSK